jgi:tetratricopeptide (TPR) repeat protein
VVHRSRLHKTENSGDKTENSGQFSLERFKMNDKKLDNNTRPLSAQASRWSVGLKLEHLEDMLCHTIPKLVGGQAGRHYTGLASRSQSGDWGVCKAELSCASEWLSTVLDGRFSQQLSSSEVAEIHSFIGLIQEVHGNYDSACKSHVKALWVASQATDFPEDQRAAILCRLGNAYGRTGNYEQMQHLYEKAAEINGGPAKKMASKRRLSFRRTKETPGGPGAN